MTRAHPVLLLNVTQTYRYRYGVSLTNVHALRVRLYAAIVYTHHRRLVLLSSKADIRFTIPWRWKAESA